MMTTVFSTVLAQGVKLAPKAGSPFSGLTGLTFGALVGFAINAVLIIAAILFFFMLLFGGLQWIMSGGDKSGTEAARGRVTAAIIGLVIVFSAFIILQLVFAAFGLDQEEGLEFGTIEGL